MNNALALQLITHLSEMIHPWSLEETGKSLYQVTRDKYIYYTYLVKILRRSNEKSMKLCILFRAMQNKLFHHCPLLKESDSSFIILGYYSNLSLSLNLNN